MKDKLLMDTLDNLDAKQIAGLLLTAGLLALSTGCMSQASPAQQPPTARFEAAPTPVTESLPQAPAGMVWVKADALDPRPVALSFLFAGQLVNGGTLMIDGTFAGVQVGILEAGQVLLKTAAKISLAALMFTEGALTLQGQATDPQIIPQMDGSTRIISLARRTVEIRLSPDQQRALQQALADAQVNAQAGTQAEAKMEVKDQEREKRTRTNVLIIEDDPSYQEVLEEVAASYIAGGQLFVYDNCYEPIEQLSGAQIDLAIVDHNFRTPEGRPVVKGEECVRLIRQKWPQSKIIFYPGNLDRKTADGKTGIGPQAMTNGANAVIEKNGPFSEFMSTINQLLNLP